MMLSLFLSSSNGTDVAVVVDRGITVPVVGDVDSDVGVTVSLTTGGAVDTDVEALVSDCAFEETNLSGNVENEVVAGVTVLEAFCTVVEVVEAEDLELKSSVITINIDMQSMCNHHTYYTFMHVCLLTRLTI